MTTRNASITLVERRSAFDRALKDAVELGVSPGSDGINPTTRKAIMVVATEYPDATNESVQNAKKAFQQWLDWLAS